MAPRTRRFRPVAVQWSRLAEPIGGSPTFSGLGTLRRVLNPRPSAWALVCVLVVGLLGSAGTAVTFAVDKPTACTAWTDEYHPPTEIRVYRNSGPNAGHVELVPFWNYVGTVLAAEYSTSGPKGPVWFRMGAVSVKQYGWYYTMHYRGGKVTNYNEDGTVASYECFDVRDSTLDQLYKPERMVDGVWVPRNVPSAANLAAMAETWHVSLRKWMPDKQRSRFFLTGYRSGKKNPCGADAKGFRIMQKSLADCIVKGLVYEETTRVYYEPNVLIVDPREHDILDDDDTNGEPTYFGDLGALTPGANANKTGWRLYAGLNDTNGDPDFAAPVTGSFDIASANIVSQGVGDVNGDVRNDLVMLAGNKIWLAVATGAVVGPNPPAGYLAPTSQTLPDGAPSAQMVVADFNGDLLADVGLLRSTPVTPLPNEPATLVVMKGNSNGTFSAPADWWRGPLDLTTQVGSVALNQVAAGDVNGDGKADLIVRNLSGGFNFYVAATLPSCADISVWGPCPAPNPPGLADAALWFSNTDWLTTPTPEWTVTDFNRDGRSDVVIAVKNGSGVDFFGAHAVVGGGSFINQHKMANLGNQTLDDMTMLGLDINPDGLGDVALLKKNGANTTVQWLRATQALGSATVTYVTTTGFNDSGLPWAPATTRAY
jgi:hypothetical protein